MTAVLPHRTPLNRSRVPGNLDACSYLVHEAGADLQLRNRDSDTPFDVVRGRYAG